MKSKKLLLVSLCLFLVAFFVFVLYSADVNNIDKRKPILTEPVTVPQPKPVETPATPVLVVEKEEEIVGPAVPVFDENMECLAVNVYHEARGESLAGQYAVSDVVLNRVESRRFPDTICDVVHQSKTWNGHPIRNKCHFSWYCDGKSDVPKDTDAWHKAKEVAISILGGKHRGLTEGSTHYHATYVNPSWNKNMHLVSTIGDHIFYIER